VRVAARLWFLVQVVPILSCSTSMPKNAASLEAMKRSLLGSPAAGVQCWPRSDTGTWLHWKFVCWGRVVLQRRNTAGHSPPQAECNVGADSWHDHLVVRVLEHEADGFIY
jgi:hypothetical protein